MLENVTFEFREPVYQTFRLILRFSGIIQKGRNIL